MKNFYQPLARIAGLALMCAVSTLSVQAASYFDFDDINVDLVPNETYLMGDFNIAVGDADGLNSDGYLDGVANGEYLSTAVMTFQVQDQAGNPLKFVVSFGNVVGFSGTLVQAINITDVSGNVTGTGLATLAASGVLTYTLQNTGDSPFTLLTGLLEVETESGSPGTPVPDSSNTVVLVGLALTGIAACYRRRLSVI